MREFDTGAVRDTDDSKEDFSETISWTAFKRYAQYMTGKKKKYGAGNFKKGIPIESYEQSLLRHVQKYMENKYEEGTVETEEDHLSAMVFNIFGIMHEEERIKKITKIPTEEEQKSMMDLVKEELERLRHERERTEPKSPYKFTEPIKPYVCKSKPFDDILTVTWKYLSRPQVSRIIKRKT